MAKRPEDMSFFELADELDKWDDEPLESGFSPNELTEAFDLVKDAEDWKNPIDAVIDANKQKIVDSAILFCAGSVSHFSYVNEDELRVQAKGYSSFIYQQHT